MINTISKKIQRRLTRYRNVYKPHNDRYHCIFIHIPKCAGISIEEALFQEKVGHHALTDYKYANIYKYLTYFKFTFVRNPWARAVSAFHFLKQGGQNPVDEKWAKSNLSQFDTFEDFVLCMKNTDFRKKILGHQHFRPQYKYITNEFGKLAIDYFGHVEQLSKDVHVVANKLGISVTLDRKNRSNHNHYTEYYTPETKNIVECMYKKDINLLGYKFEN